MKELTLAEIKKIELEILETFADFCQQNQISYFLSNGTLLGAVKYGGFIPWDDDIDVLVPREDYERFLRLFPDSERFVLLARQRCNKFYYPFAKLCDNSTILEEFNIDDGVCLGINIDIFPLDSWAPTLKEAQHQAIRNKKRTKVLGYAKTIQFIPGEKRSFLGKWVRRIAHPLVRGVGPDRFCESMEREAKCYQQLCSPQYLGSIAWPVYSLREVFESWVFADTVDVSFEGTQHPAPVGYDAYLTSLYGDYRLDPPSEKQISHHNFVAYRK